MLGLFRAYPQRTNGFNSARFIYIGCVPDKSWSMWRCGTISACCVNSACYPGESWRRFSSMFQMVADPRAAEALSASVEKASARKPVLPDLRNECVSNHDFWHPPRELQNVVPYPV